MSDITPQQRAAVDEIMDNFDFGEVHRTMKHLGWTWASLSDRAPSVPDEFRLRRSARKRLYNLFEEDLCKTASGGLVATKDDGYLSLEFVLSDWESKYG
jgi:hypothetical protein